MERSFYVASDDLSIGFVRRGPIRDTGAKPAIEV